MKKFPIGYLYLGLGLLGMAGGALWWHYFGCTDSCPINSKVHWMMLRGSLIGLCLAAIIHPGARRARKSGEQA